MNRPVVPCAVLWEVPIAAAAKSFVVLNTVQLSGHACGSLRAAGRQSFVAATFVSDWKAQNLAALFGTFCHLCVLAGHLKNLGDEGLEPPTFTV